MVSTTTLLTAAIASVAMAGDAPWQCYKSCGRALSEWNQCKRYHGEKFNKCLCAEDSRFNQFLDPCLGCADYVWEDFKHSLSIPMGKCGIPTPDTKN